MCSSEHRFGAAPVICEATAESVLRGLRLDLLFVPSLCAPQFLLAPTQSFLSWIELLLAGGKHRLPIELD